MSQTDLIIHDEKDNVAVVVVNKRMGLHSQIIEFKDQNNKTIKVKAEPDSSFKSLIELLRGDTILKYGHDIGKVIKPVKKGDHVHVHNVKTKKW